MSVASDAKLAHSTIQTWKHMIARCHDPRIAKYKPDTWMRYGGRGITVCDRWRYSLDNFLNDMGVRPAEGLELDRINNDGNYEPSNCRWVTGKENAQNRSTSISVTWNGITKNASEWARDFGLNSTTFHQRYNAGMSMEQIRDTVVHTDIKTRARNRKSNINLTYKGKTQCVSQWAIELNLPVKTLYVRLELGWDTAKVLETPINEVPSVKLTEYIYPDTGEITQLSQYAVAKLTGQSVGAIRDKLAKGLPTEEVLSTKRQAPITTAYYDFNGSNKTVPEIAKALNVSDTLVYRWLREGIDPNAMKPSSGLYSSPNIIDYNGKSQSITEWGRELGIGDDIIRSRLKQGMTMDRVMSTESQREQKHTFMGELKTAKEISVITGMDIQGVRRLIRNKVDLDTYEFNPPEVVLDYNGKTQSIKVWAEELGIPVERIRYRIKHGFSTEEILSPQTLREKTYVYKGEQLTPTEISKLSGKSDAWVRKCIREGLDLDTVLEGSTREKKYLYEGELRTVKEIVVISGRSKAAVYRMIKYPS